MQSQRGQDQGQDYRYTRKIQWKNLQSSNPMSCAFSLNTSPANSQRNAAAEPLPMPEKIDSSNGNTRKDIK